LPPNTQTEQQIRAAEMLSQANNNGDYNAAISLLHILGATSQPEDEPKAKSTNTTTAQQ